MNASQQDGALETGIKMHEAHFPGTVPIDFYGNGGFKFSDMAHTGSLLCLPSGIYGWKVKSAADFNAKAFASAFDEADKIEIFLIGTGADIALLDEKLMRRLEKAGIGVDLMSTGAAVRTYNVLLAEGRAVASALVAV